MLELGPSGLLHALSINSSLPDKKNRMKPVDESPRFVVGHCRQFTTVLYNCSLNDRTGILSAKKMHLFSSGTRGGRMLAGEPARN